MVSVAHLENAGLYLSLVIGCFILLLGSIGNILNVLVFTHPKATFRKSSCSDYFVAIAIINTLHMLHGLPHRILSGGFDIDPTLTSHIYCKLRQYLVSSLPFMRNTLSCIATISQYFATSRRAHRRQRSTHKAARLYITICIVFWSLHAIPYLVLYKIDSVPTTNKTRCDAFNKTLSQYTSWFLYNVLTFILPGSLLTVFGYLTLRNVRRLGNAWNQSQKRQQIERQMSLMLLIQVAFLVIGYIPFGVMSIYMTITQASPKSSEREAIESFVDTVAFIVVYVNSGNSFYLFYLTSAAFRIQCRKTLQALCHCKRKYETDRTVPSRMEIQTVV